MIFKKKIKTVEQLWELLKSYTIRDEFRGDIDKAIQYRLPYKFKQGILTEADFEEIMSAYESVFGKSIRKEVYPRILEVKINGMIRELQSLYKENKSEGEPTQEIAIDLEGLRVVSDGIVEGFIAWRSSDTNC